MDILSFSGRARRMDFWLVSIGLWFVQSLISVMLVFSVLPLLVSATVPGQTVPVAAIVGLVMRLAFLWPITAVAVRRSHDRNLSGWWYGAYIIAGFGLEIWSLAALTPTISVGGAPVGVMNALAMALWAVGLIFLIVLGFLPGTPGRNRFGHAPHSRHQNYRTPLMDLPGEPVITDEPAPLR
ncbi:DUF805 domain-containing protein [uncultured Brevundimonas sp.]|uniref:DUF805 domain-containing protein n=1 Tax=uncultured Brevundimonas sp. TaxID=213418 RepID=UPI0030ED63C3|tara:strand:+ start:2467 stop:3012 length:546 start_codon:yes stop_codon:yes gene_type:complete